MFLEGGFECYFIGGAKAAEIAKNIYEMLWEKTFVKNTSIMLFSFENHIDERLLTFWIYLFFDKRYCKYLINVTYVSLSYSVDELWLVKYRAT